MALPPNVRDLVRYALHAYRDDYGFRALTERELTGHPINARNIQSTRFAHTQAHLAIRNGNNTLVLAFRGTDFPMHVPDFLRIERWFALIHNALIDISYGFTNLGWLGLPNILVHEGFLSGFIDLVPNLILSIDALLGHTAPTNIEVCGHSLGGALATLCALWCRLRWQHANITCVTLGSPRVGNVDFAGVFRNHGICCYRLVVISDPITAIPNKIIEMFPLRYSPNTLFRLAFRQGGAAHIWAHVAVQTLLPGPQGNLLVRGLQTVTLAAHDPLHYVVTVCNAPAAPAPPPA